MLEQRDIFSNAFAIISDDLILDVVADRPVIYFLLLDAVTNEPFLSDNDSTCLHEIIMM